MELSGELTIFASRTAVWAALNDAAVLARCIEGCESLEAIAPDRFQGRVSAKVGPVRATFSGVVTLADLVVPARYRLIGAVPHGAPIRVRIERQLGYKQAKFVMRVEAVDSLARIGEGKGGAAGFAKGEADIMLAEEGPSTTRLTYAARASVGGKLAQLGGRLIEGTAKGYADRFFAALKAELEQGGAPIPMMAEPEPAVGLEAEPADIGPDAAMAELVQEQPALVPPAAPPEPRGGVPLAVWAGVLAVLTLLLLAYLLRG